MTATALQIAEVRRMVAEPTTTTYSDVLVTAIIESYPMMDELGTNPYYWTQVAGVPTKTTDPVWVATYDLNAAAAKIWTEKASALAAKFDFKADGGDYSRSQAYEHAKGQADFYAKKRSMTTVHLIKSPKESGAGNISSGSWIGNLPETDIFGDDVMYLNY